MFPSQQDAITTKLQQELAQIRTKSSNNLLADATTATTNSAASTPRTYSSRITSTTNNNNNTKNNRDDIENQIVEGQSYLATPDPPAFVFIVLAVQLKRLKRSEDILTKREKIWLDECKTSDGLYRSRGTDYFPRYFDSLPLSEIDFELKKMNIRANNDPILKRLVERKRKELSLMEIKDVIRRFHLSISELKNGILQFEYWTQRERFIFLKQQLAEVASAKNVCKKTTKHSYCCVTISLSIFTTCWF